jgi:hypothetical protein
LTAWPAAARPRAQSPGAGLLAGGVAALAATAFVLIGALAALGGASLGAGGASAYDGQSDGVSALARREIPAAYLRLYQQAAHRYGLDWAILAGIGKVECDHGRDPDPSGAGGPMQFVVSTWAKYGVDGDGDGRVDRWDPADAIDSAANYLRASGALRDLRRALLAYNDAEWYVTDVESWASRYRGSSTPLGAPTQIIEADPREGADIALEDETATSVRFIAGERAELEPGDGHVALVPAGVPASVQAMVVAGNELQDLPYGPGGHPDPLGALEEDCSSTLNYVLYRAGIRPITEIVKYNPLAQDYVDWGAPGPGRWVTIYATASPVPHVFAVIAGLRLDTSHDGTDVGPNRRQGGPRWRVLDRIPAWAKWSVRHPPGL